MNPLYKWDELIPLRQKNSQEYNPTQQQILQYAEYIGIQLPEDEHLMYLAREGIVAQLPEQWQACQAPDGEMFYRNKLTKVIQDEHPLDQIYRRKVILLKESQLQAIQAYYDMEFELGQKDKLPAIEEENNQMSQSQCSYDNEERIIQNKINNLKGSSSLYLKSRIQENKLKSRQFSKQLGSYHYSNNKNDELSRNISEKFDNYYQQSGSNPFSSSSYHQHKQTKILPSSLLQKSSHKQNKNQQQQQQQQLKLINKLSSQRSYELMNQGEEEMRKIYNERRLEDVLKQKELKQMLLSQLKQNNFMKMEQLRRRIKDKVGKKNKKNKHKHQQTQRIQSKIRQLQEHHNVPINTNQLQSYYYNFKQYVF